MYPLFSRMRTVHTTRNNQKYLAMPMPFIDIKYFVLLNWWVVARDERGHYQHIYIPYILTYSRDHTMISNETVEYFFLKFSTNSK